MNDVHIVRHIKSVCAAVAVNFVAAVVGQKAVNNIVMRPFFFDIFYKLNILFKVLFKLCHGFF